MTMAMRVKLTLINALNFGMEPKEKSEEKNKVSIGTRYIWRTKKKINCIRRRLCFVFVCYFLYRWLGCRMMWHKYIQRFKWQVDKSSSLALALFTEKCVCVCMCAFLADEFNMADPKFEANDSCPLNAPISSRLCIVNIRIYSFVSFSYQTMEIWNQATNICYSSNDNWTISFVNCIAFWFWFNQFFFWGTN